MRVIVPRLIDDTIITSSTIAEPDTGEIVFAAGPLLPLGTERIVTSTHRVYQVVDPAGTTDDPLVGIVAVPPTWVNVRPTNKFAMFDNVNSTQSEETTQLITEFEFGVVTDSVAGFNIADVDNINVTVTDPVEGEVFNVDVDMNDTSKINGFWEWHFIPINKKREFVVLNLPYFSDATIKLTADGTDIKFGNLIIGNETILGATKIGSSLQILDFSRKETDDFGNTVVTPGRNSKLVDFDVNVPIDDVGFVFNTLSDLTTTPSVWSGTDEVDDPTLAFGYFRDVQQNISTHIFTDLTISVESLT